MKAPRRLLDDPNTAPELRGELGRTAASSVHYDCTSGLAALQARLQTDPSAAPPDAAAAASGVAPSIVLKLSLLAAMGGTVALAVSWLPRAPEPSASPAPPVVTATALPTPEPGPQERTATPADLAVVSAPVVSTAPERDASAALRREIAQLARIRELLERDPKAAHRAIRAAQREFPDGVLREEREGLDALALYRSGDRAAARAAAEAFVERYPKSTLRPRLERMLAGEAP